MVKRLCMSTGVCHQSDLSLVIQTIVVSPLKGAAPFKTPFSGKQQFTTEKFLVHSTEKGSLTEIWR